MLVNSFDVFDTIIGRRCYLPEGVFEEVEAVSGYRGFKNKRQKAERDCPMPKAFDDIYNQLIINEKCDAKTADMLKSLELQKEYENIFPIKYNLNKIENGDILVSDTYFDANQIRKFLDHVGFNKQVEIYATIDGKYSGWIWDVIKKKYTVKLHIGDNQHSDVLMPRKYGINTAWFDRRNFRKNIKMM